MKTPLRQCCRESFSLATKKTKRIYSYLEWPLEPKLTHFPEDLTCKKRSPPMVTGPSKAAIHTRLEISLLHVCSFACNDLFWGHIDGITLGTWRFLRIFFGNNFTIVKLLTICLFSFRSLPNYLPQRSVPLCPHMITSIAQLWRVSLLQRVQLVMWQHDLHARSSIWKAGKHHRKLKDAFDQVMAHGKLKYVENRWKILGGGFNSCLLLPLLSPT